MTAKGNEVAGKLREKTGYPLETFTVPVIRNPVHTTFGWAASCLELFSKGEKSKTRVFSGEFTPNVCGPQESWSSYDAGHNPYRYHEGVNG